MRRHLTIGLCLALAVGLLALCGCSKGEFVGSRFSNKYHDPSCVWAEQTSPENQVWFSSAEEAEAADYIPCPTCLPDE